MELTALRYFIAVAEELHFRRAAERLHVTQPPLSAQIRKLEEELETELFRRTSRVVELTEAGKLFLEEARIIVGRAEGAARKLAEFTGSRLRKLAVGYNEPVLNTFLPPAVVRFHRKHPEVRLSLRALPLAAQLEALRRGEIDLALCRPYGAELSEFSSRPLFSEPYVAALPAAHPLAAKAAIRLPMLDGENLLLFSRNENPLLFDELERRMREAGIAPVILQEAADKASMLALVAAGLGIAILPRSCARSRKGRVTVRPLKAPFPTVDIQALTLPGEPSPMLQKFLEEILVETALMG